MPMDVRTAGKVWRSKVITQCQVSSAMDLCRKSCVRYWSFRLLLDAKCRVIIRRAV